MSSDKPEERKPMTDRDRLNWMIKREVYVSEHQTVPRWGAYSSQACLEVLGEGGSPRAAIDAAMARDTELRLLNARSGIADALRSRGYAVEEVF